MTPEQLAELEELIRQYLARMREAIARQALIDDDY